MISILVSCNFVFVKEKNKHLHANKTNDLTMQRTDHMFSIQHSYFAISNTSSWDNWFAV